MKNIERKIFHFLAVLGVIAFCVPFVYAVPAPKVFVCKYVGTPQVNETLQTGQNPISVSQNAIPNFQGIGSYFADAQGRSLVIAFDIGQDEPECPAPQSPPPPPVVDLCPNIIDIQSANDLEITGYVVKDGLCVPKDVTPPTPQGSVQPINEPVPTNIEGKRNP